MKKPNVSHWSIQRCWKYLDHTLGIDLNTIDWIADDDVEGWRAEVERRLEVPTLTPEEEAERQQLRRESQAWMDSLNGEIPPEFEGDSP